jgi:hypothetical protein
MQEVFRPMTYMVRECHKGNDFFTEKEVTYMLFAQLDEQFSTKSDKTGFCGGIKAIFFDSP